MVAEHQADGEDTDNRGPGREQRPHLAGVQFGRLCESGGSLDQKILRVNPCLPEPIAGQFLVDESVRIGEPAKGGLVQEPGDLRCPQCEYMLGEADLDARGSGGEVPGLPGLLNGHPQVAVRDGKRRANGGSGSNRLHDSQRGWIDTRHEPLRVDRPDGTVADRQIQRIPADAAADDPRRSCRGQPPPELPDLAVSVVDDRPRMVSADRRRLDGAR